MRHALKKSLLFENSDHDIEGIISVGDYYLLTNEEDYQKYSSIMRPLHNHPVKYPVLISMIPEGEEGWINILPLYLDDVEEMARIMRAYST